MVNWHRGSWGGFPDIGATEWLAGKLSGGKTTDLSRSITGQVPAKTSYTPPPQEETGKFGLDPSDAPRPATRTVTTKETFPDKTTPTGDTGGSGGGGGGGGDGNTDVNSLYEPTMNYLNQLESEFKKQKPGALETVQRGYEESLVPVGEQEKTNLANIETQGRGISTREQNALQQARQLYGELTQGNVGRFGGGTSTGEAANEILGRATMQQITGISGGAGESRRQLEIEKTRVQDFANNQRTSLKRWREEAIQKVEQEFSSGIMNINQNRSMAETAKATAKADLMQQARAQSFQVEQAQKAFERQILLFETQKAGELDKQYGIPDIQKEYFDLVDRLIKGGMSDYNANQTAGQLITSRRGANSLPSELLNLNPSVFAPKLVQSKDLMGNTIFYDTSTGTAIPVGGSGTTGQGSTGQTPAQPPQQNFIQGLFNPTQPRA
mgnify:CR=1 FL=1